MTEIFEPKELEGSDHGAIVVAGEVVGVHIDDAYADRRPVRRGQGRQRRAARLHGLFERDRDLLDAPAALGSGLDCDSRPPCARASSRSARLQMRAVVHLPVDADDAGIAGAAKAATIACELRDRFGRGREDLVDDRHLRRVDRHLAGEAVALGLEAFRPQAVRVAEIDEDRVDRRDFGGGGARGWSGAREAEHVGVAAVLVARGARADRGRKILRAPGQRRQGAGLASR